MKWAQALLQTAARGTRSLRGLRPARLERLPDWRDTVLETERCIVRAAQPEDAFALFEASAHVEFNRWLTWERPVSAALIEKRFAEQLRGWSRGQSLCFSVVERASGAVFAGADLKLDPIDGRPTTRNLGYWTHPEQQNRGYAREFVPVVVNWAFQTAGAARLIAGAAPANVASRRVLLRLGFAPFETRRVGRAGHQFESIRYLKSNPDLERFGAAGA